MKHYIPLTVLVVLFALVVGCASTGNVFSKVTDGLSSGSAPTAPESYNQGGGVAGQKRSTLPQSLPAATPAAAPTQVAAAGDSAQAQDQQRMIVYTGSMSLQVNDTTDTLNKITDLLKGVNGYIASRSLVAYGKDKLRGTIVVRIPAAALETTLGQIKALGVKVLKEDANSNDVTEEYVDLDARRKNLEAYEVELQKLLDTVRERTGKAEDILAVYNQLTEVRGQIEQIKGRQKYLENTSTLATYTIELVPIEEVVVQGKPGWDPLRTAGAALDQLVSTLQGLGDVAITVVLYILPVLVILLLPVAIVVLIIRAFLRRRTPKKTVTA